MEYQNFNSIQPTRNIEELKNYLSQIEILYPDLNIIKRIAKNEVRVEWGESNKEGIPTYIKIIDNKGDIIFFEDTERISEKQNKSVRNGGASSLDQL